MNFLELMVILIVALLVLGPQRLFRLAFIIGRAIRAGQKLATQKKDDLETEWRREKLQRNIAEATTVEDKNNHSQ